MSTLRIRVCRQIKLTSTQKIIDRFLSIIHIWIKQVMEHKEMKSKCLNYEQIVGEKLQFLKSTSIQNDTNQFFTTLHY